MPTILIIFGITGDLGQRKLLPALGALKEAGELPEKFRVIGVSRKAGSEHFSMDLDDPKDYERLKNEIQAIERLWGSEALKLFHLAVPPIGAPAIIEELGQSGLAEGAKILLEKPFGRNITSAEELAALLGRYFSEEQIYRIDHFLEKDIARELSKINIEDISKVEILASGERGIEERASFYEETGELRDMVATHLLELAALVLSAPGQNGSPEARAKALETLSVVSASRGQYDGYRKEVGNPKTNTETLASLTLASSDARFANTPIFLAAGKALDEKETEVAMVRETEAPLSFCDAPAHGALEGYAKVYLDALRGDRSRFVSLPETLASWKLVEGVQAAWERSGDDLIFYKKGSSLKSIVNRP